MKDCYIFNPINIQCCYCDHAFSIEDDGSEEMEPNCPKCKKQFAIYLTREVHYESFCLEHEPTNSKKGE